MAQSPQAGALRHRTLHRNIVYARACSYFCLIMLPTPTDACRQTSLCFRQGNTSYQFSVMLRLINAHPRSVGFTNTLSLIDSLLDSERRVARSSAHCRGVLRNEFTRNRLIFVQHRTKARCANRAYLRKLINMIFMEKVSILLIGD
jgi:hypothetical protein